MKLIKTTVVILMIATITACHKGEQISANDVQVQEIQLEDIKGNISKASEPELNGFMADSAAPVALQAGQPATNIDWDKKIIKTARVKLEVKDYAGFNQNLHNLVKRYGAYIASEQQTESEEKINNDISIKVPVTQFEELMNTLPAQDGKVLEKNISTEDVTGEVMDTKARMIAKKAMRDRYLELMKQAKNMKEVLEVQNEINDIQEQIESGTGRVDFLVHQSAYSTIHVSYFQILQANYQENPSPTFFTKLREAFTDGSSIITGLLLLLVTFWPLWFVGIIVFFVAKKWKSRLVKP